MENRVIMCATALVNDNFVPLKRPMHNSFARTTSKERYVDKRIQLSVDMQNLGKNIMRLRDYPAKQAKRHNYYSPLKWER